ncbi:MAG: CheR family methyltransferase [Bacteroidota bacterium]|nr:CheR family methyltransferase [Bacteroidota bacterium]
MEITTQDIQSFLDFIKDASKYDFSSYSIKSFTRRLAKLTLDENLTIPEIIIKAENNSSYLDEIVKNITVNTTELFRDPEIWNLIRKNVLHRYSTEKEINIWHPGVSTGQEAFSLMVYLDQFGLFNRANIIATDLNRDVLETAKTGKYKYREIDEYIENYNNSFEEGEIPPMSRYFNISRRKNLIKVDRKLTKKANFTVHDLTSLINPTNHKYHMILCRNLLIYFNHEMQNKIFQFFYDNLEKGGALIIGRHEGILSNLVSKFNKKGVIYIKK